MAAGCDRIHFDIMDGQFVPPITFGHELVKALQALRSVPFEAHLMTQTPEKHFEGFAEAGCETVIFHAEATIHASRLIQQLKSMGVKAGIAINPATPVEVLEPVIKDLDLALVMTVNPGWGGQAFISSALSKVSHLRKLRSDLDIEVDGGINATTIKDAWSAGANVFVAGNFLVKSPSFAEGMQKLRAACA